MRDEAFVEAIVKIIDYWSGLGQRTLDGDADLSFSTHGDEYRAIPGAIRGTNAGSALKHLLKELCEGTAHSILALIDGDGALPPSLVVSAEDRQLVAGGALHEKLMDKLVAG